MVKASKGVRRRTRNVLQKRPRQRGLSPITHEFQIFEIGDKAAINMDPSVHKGMASVKFQGCTGTVSGKRGDAYLLQIMDGGKQKEVIIRPQHMKRIR